MQEGAHGEARLFGPVGVLRANRAGPARPAAKAHAIRAGRALQMADAGGDIVARAGERADGTGVQAPASRAGFAWAWDWRRLGNGERFAKPKRAAVGMP